jgi:hypothetical protein
MSYADTLLSTGERITHRVRQHWLVLLWGARIPIAALVASLLILVLSSAASATGLASQLLGLLTAVLFIGGLVFLAWATLRYLNTEFVLTNRRVVQVEGVVNKRATDSSLEKINDAVLTQSIFGRMFGFGDLDVLTAAEAGIERFRMIIDPIGFKRAMLDAKHEYEVDMERAGWQPSPPIRAAGGSSTTPAGSGAPGPTAPAPRTGDAGSASASPGAGTPPAGGATPPAPPESTAPGHAGRVNPDEVTRTLASLADLRDRGAISEAEYESKKADLLSRL